MIKRLNTKNVITEEHFKEPITILTRNKKRHSKTEYERITMTEIKMTPEEIEALRKEMIDLAYSNNGQEQEQILTNIWAILDNVAEKKHHYDLIFENLTRDICELYIENARSIAPILEPLFVDLSRLSRLAIKAMNTTVIRWYLKLKGKDEVVELLETNAGNEWMEKNLQEIKETALSKDEDEFED